MNTVCWPTVDVLNLHLNSSRMHIYFFNFFEIISMDGQSVKKLLTSNYLLAKLVAHIPSVNVILTDGLSVKVVSVGENFY